MNEGESSAYEHIRSRKTLEEILEVAQSFEASARDFYTDLIPKVSKNFRWLVEEYRVQVFAQQLGTAEKVSKKRLEEAWEAVRHEAG